MDDGYFAFTDTLRATPACRGSTNTMRSSARRLVTPMKSAWQKGVYRRDFENGIALVNPKGNGAQTLRSMQDFKRIAGKQVTSINNGQIVRTLTLKDRDGIILLA